MTSDHVVLCDFDGTITDRDVAASIISEFSTVDWKSIEDRYINGAITSRQELAEQFSHVNVPEEKIFEFIDENISLDPTFRYFMDFCKLNDIPITIVSEGLDFYIEHMLLQKGLSIPIRVNEGSISEDGCIQINFFTEHEKNDCGKCGNCKSSFLDEQKRAGKTIIYIGDGRSDYCPAKKADVVFAKRSLANYLRGENIMHNPFNSFSDIVAMMEEFI